MNDEIRSQMLALRAKVVAVQESERRRLARELHDDLGQQVALLLIKLDTATEDRQVSRTRLLVSLLEIRDGVRRLATAIHDLSHELYPARLRLLGLEQTLRALCREVSIAGDAQVNLHSDHLPAEVPETVALCIVRVAQESLQNALKHSNARLVDVLLRATPSLLSLRITDDGQGFDSMASRPTGIGLLTMRERVELLGGRLIVTTARGCGTTIEATVPLSDLVAAARVPQSSAAAVSRGPNGEAESAKWDVAERGGDRKARVLDEVGKE